MRYMLTVLMILMVAAEARAESGEGPAADIRAGSGALMFDLGGLFSATPTNFEGIGIGGRYAVLDRLMIRAALGFDSFSDSVKLKGFSESENTDKDSTFAIEGGADFVLFRNENVMIYTGALLQYGMVKHDPEGEDNTTDGKSVTFAALAGATWFFTRNVSLGAEYRLGVQRTVFEDEDSEQTQFRFGTGSAAFHFGFWF